MEGFAFEKAPSGEERLLGENGGKETGEEAPAPSQERCGGLNQDDGRCREKRSVAEYLLK